MKTEMKTSLITKTIKRSAALAVVPVGLIQFLMKRADIGGTPTSPENAQTAEVRVLRLICGTSKPGYPVGAEGSTSAIL